MENLVIYSYRHTDTQKRIHEQKKNLEYDDYDDEMRSKWCRL